MITGSVNAAEAKARTTTAILRFRCITKPVNSIEWMATRIIRFPPNDGLQINDLLDGFEQLADLRIGIDLRHHQFELLRVLEGIDADEQFLIGVRGDDVGETYAPIPRG